MLNAAANTLGWGTRGNLVMSGFTHPPDFARVVKKKLMWKDMVASGHGEFTHMIQWMVIHTYMFDQAPVLYADACDYFCEGIAYNKGKKAYLWDFIVDCFPTPPETDWRAGPTTGTARSPTIANAIIFNSGGFLGTMLKARYVRKDYMPPSDSRPAYTSTSRPSHLKHLKPGEPAPIALESDALRENRKVFEASKGFRGLMTRGYASEEVKDKPARMGYLFARADRALSAGSSLMSIAQKFRL